MIKNTFIKKASAFAAASALIVISVFTAHCTNYGMLDDANELFTSSEAASLEERLEEASNITGWDVRVYVAEDSYSEELMEEFYNSFYDNSDYAEDGVLLVIDNDGDKRIIITKGEAMYCFGDSRMEHIKSELRPYIDEYDYYSVVDTYAYEVEQAYYDDGEDFDTYDNVQIAREDMNFFERAYDSMGIFLIIVPLAAGLIFFFTVFFRYRFHGKSDTYDLHENSKINLNSKEDVFVTSRVTSRKIQSSSSGSSSRRSSGSSHGSSGTF